MLNSPETSATSPFEPAEVERYVPPFVDMAVSTENEGEFDGESHHLRYTILHTEDAPLIQCLLLIMFVGKDADEQRQ